MRYLGWSFHRFNMCIDSTERNYSAAVDQMHRRPAHYKSTDDDDDDDKVELTDLKDYCSS